MAILGKDLWGGESTDFFEFTALFSNDRIEIGERSYRYAQITTDFLNYDPLEYKKAMNDLKIAHGNKDKKKYVEASKLVNTLILSMPLYNGFTKIENLMADRGYEMVTGLLDFAKFLGAEVYHHYSHYLQLEGFFDTLLPRYKWFLREMFCKDLGKRSNNRYAFQIEENCVSAFVSGVSLGASPEVDPAQTSVKYEVQVSAETGEPQLYEKMGFTRLADFIYTDFFKGMMKDSIPKRCKLCGRYFLQEKGVTFEYCDNPPIEGDNTCRLIGALTSFRDKVRNNDVWKIHQRAYKKYYARVLKKKMSKVEFNEWAQDAEKLRDETLVEYEAAVLDGTAYSLDDYTARINER